MGWKAHLLKWVIRKYSLIFLESLVFWAQKRCKSFYWNRMETPIWGDTFWKALWKQPPSQMSYKPQLLKSRGTQLGIRDFFPAQLINERLLWKPRHASLKPGTCTVTLSWVLAQTEIIIEALKVTPEITTLPPAFWLGMTSLPGKVKANLACPSPVPEAGGRNRGPAPPPTCHSTLVMSHCSPWTSLSGDRRDHLPSSPDY